MFSSNRLQSGPINAAKVAGKNSGIIFKLALARFQYANMGGKHERSCGSNSDNRWYNE